MHNKSFRMVGISAALVTCTPGGGFLYGELATFYWYFLAGVSTSNGLGV
jgi:hypothetical protein